MLVYILVILSVVIISLIELIFKKKINVSIYAFIGFILIILSAFRGELGNDTVVYLSFFQNLDFSNVTFYLLQFEIGFVYLSLLIKQIFNNDVFYISSIALISISLKMKYVYKISPLPAISLFTLVSAYFLALDMGQIRQGIALSLIFIALYHYLKENKKLFYFFVLIATFFHISAFLFLIIVFLKKNISNYIILFCIFFSFIFVFIPINELIISFIKLLFFWNDFIFTKLMNYAIGKYSEIVGFSIIQIWYLLISVVFVYYKKIINNSTYSFLLNVFAVGIILNFVFNSFPALIRASYYFLAIEGFLVAYVIYESKKKYNRYILFLIIVSMGLLRYYLYLNNRIETYII